jgi:hypothetical protein
LGEGLVPMISSLPQNAELAMEKVLFLENNLKFLNQ